MSARSRPSRRSAFERACLSEDRNSTAAAGDDVHTKMFRHLLIASSLWVLAAAALAGSPPPLLVDESGWNPTESKPPSSAVLLGSFRLGFETTRLEDVRHAAGVGAITHQGDAADSIYWLCYTASVAGSHERIWILSSGEMGGPEHEITGVSAQLSQSFRAIPSCPALPAKLTPMRLDRGFWLRSTNHEVAGALGTPSRQQAGWLFYDFSGKSPQKCEGGFYDVTNGLQVRIQHGLVTDVRASQVTSC